MQKFVVSDCARLSKKMNNLHKPLLTQEQFRFIKQHLPKSYMDIISDDSTVSLTTVKKYFRGSRIKFELEEKIVEIALKMIADRVKKREHLRAECESLMETLLNDKS